MTRTAWESWSLASSLVDHQLLYINAWRLYISHQCVPLGNKTPNQEAKEDSPPPPTPHERWQSIFCLIPHQPPSDIPQTCFYPCGFTSSLTRATQGNRAKEHRVQRLGFLGKTITVFLFAWQQACSALGRKLLKEPRVKGLPRQKQQLARGSRSGSPCRGIPNRASWPLTQNGPSCCSGY
ncbi:endonuclease domain-containing 1 protein-like [Platysternon megacephalum]|uniref:Endonuclease domain-containing 1 protein-like n=1 Tax=Platysternon megacephalum TaxID=55544 RepID=A0A4D9DMF0_9SAUR|nr:endonuclease domain-containing 1 protein-like [Platysternon megacephalum]